MFDPADRGAAGELRAALEDDGSSCLLRATNGAEVAYYHRDRIEKQNVESSGLARCINRRRHGNRSFAARLPRIDHEWIAYLNAERRTLEFLAYPGPPERRPSAG